MIITIGSVLPDDKDNKYKVIKSIKSGGFGQVFECERETDKVHFALKTMKNEFPSSEEYNAFQNELKLAKQIKAKNVIAYQFMHDGEMYKEYQPYIIMELANQGSLKQLIDQKGTTKTFFSNAELTHMFLELSKGMECINSVLVHRDIKPENILIKDNVLKISDFGLAKYSEATTRNVTFKGYGTAPYCAPEVWKMEENTIYMDIYSMGIVFYELATLNYPYQVKRDNYEEAHLYGAVENPNIYNSGIAPNLVSIINKMLQKRKSKRFADWKEIIDMLNAGNVIGTSDSELGVFVQAAVNMQNARDNAMQKEQAEVEKKKKERDNHIKNIMFSFKNEILNQLNEYAQLFNSQCASGKMEMNMKRFELTSETNSITIRMPNSQMITVELTVVDPDNFKQTIGYTQSYGVNTPTATRYSHPTFRGKKVLAWGKIEDSQERGYNILLLESNEDEYGDWYILYNRNSGFRDSTRIEPFAFSEEELPKEITMINTVFHKYSSELEKYELKRFQELIAMGSVFY